MSARGVIAAGHPVTAEAGAQVLREDGNAIDAAVCAVLTSFVTESPLTGLGAGGFMLVHTGDEDVLLDFFVQVPGSDGHARAAELVPIEVFFDETPQVFNIGAASCGVPGTAAGLAEALRRWGSMPIAKLARPAVQLARDGVAVNAEQAYIFKILDPILTKYPETRALYAPEGRMLREGETFRFEELAKALEHYADEGPEPFYRGEIARAVSTWVLERGGTLGPEDMADYVPVAREPARAGFRDADVLTNPPPSSGGILIAFCLDLLQRLGSAGAEAMVGAMEEANAARGEEFHAGLYEQGYLERFLSEEHVSEAAGRIVERVQPEPGSAQPGDRLGSTTHISVLDAEGRCASVTCSNGTGSGLLVPGTGVHVNNMLGEEDLNPLGFHATPAGRRMTSMMSPTIVLRDGEVVAGLGSGGSNRIRSAVLQAVVRMVADRMPVGDAVEAGRLHFEEGTVQAEPGVDASGLDRLERRGYAVARWRRKNLYFGGVHAVARDAATGELSGGGDPRRGGAVVVV
jgi:gamma-glutamyltranspeptidase/glutathione hydrolase